MKRLMGLDVGDKTIGVAVSDPLGITAQGITTIRRNGLQNDIKEIEEIILRYNVKTIVVGIPKNMNNTIGPQGEKVLNFVEELKKNFNLGIILQDERLTTISAEKTLLESDMSRKKRKKIIDMVAATYILQTHLDKINRR